MLRALKNRKRSCCELLKTQSAHVACFWKTQFVNAVVQKTHLEHFVFFQNTQHEHLAFLKMLHEHLPFLKMQR